MTDPSVPRRDYYVYALFREDGQTPFYIGKGRGHRILQHEWEAPRKNTHKDRIINKMLKNGIKVPKHKLVEGLTDGEAKQIERDLICLLGREPHGPLVNLTSGGDGVANLSAETRARKSEANRKSWADPVVRQKRIDSLKAVWTDERRVVHRAMYVEAPAEILATMKSKRQRLRDRQPKPPSFVKPPKLPQREAIKKFWADPEKRRQTLEKRKAQRAQNPLDDAAKRRMAARLTSPESRAKSHATNRVPAVRDRRVAAQRAAFSTPEAKATRSAASKKMWAAKKAQKTAPDDKIKLS